jgi:hypothetical protein
MWEIYFDTYLSLLCIFLIAGTSSLVLAVESKWNSQFFTAILLFLLALLVHVVTPTEEQMLTKEYDDIKASRPACAAVIEKNIDSASLECLREYKKYLRDSIDAAKQYYEHFSELKTDLKR